MRIIVILTGCLALVAAAIIAVWPKLKKQIQQRKMESKAMQLDGNESKFTGGLLGFIGTNILCGLIIVLSLGIATPWAICLRQKWLADHTIIDGRQQKFDGTGGGLFITYLKWCLFCIITLGFYGLWLPIKFRTWIVEHTHNA